MARRHERVSAPLLGGVASLLVLGLVVCGSLVALLTAAPGLDAAGLVRDPYLRQVIRFTLWQAFLSTLLSVGLAVPVARALARRRRFPGRGLLLRLLGLPLVMPTIVAVLGIVAVFGRSGLLAQAAGVLGLGWPSIYGLSGILVAHTFFNLPLATRLLLPAWDAVPGETWRLAAQLGMGSGAIFRLIEWPLLRQTLPGVAVLVFLLCTTSFAVVLTLGGGPAASTMEVAIYQALRFDFDLGRAVALALVQLLLGIAWLLMAQRLARALQAAPTAQRPQERPDAAAALGRLVDAAVIGGACIVVLLPLGAVLEAGLTGPLGAVLGAPGLWAAVGRTVVVAVGAGSLSLLLGVGLVAAGRELRLRRRRPRAAGLVELAGSIVLAVSPFVLGTGLFVLLMPLGGALSYGLLLVVVVNAIMGLPYVVRILAPVAARTAEQHDRLCASLGISGWNRLRLVEWPVARRSVGLALALTAALATGDLGAIALFGTQDTMTLPLLLYDRMASYQIGPAAVTALVLLGLCLAI
ncbi:MAG: thiamine/thiamine pyrophosphate ABC transporter, permease protein, partial [Rhodospirillaceae bacterium]|nr:thiamine/thiamine pyrophosphate ABC transporter, permease protein [Rhodospirillaceae bacterium]